MVDWWGMAGGWGLYSKLARTAARQSEVRIFNTKDEVKVPVLSRISRCFKKPSIATKTREDHK